MVPHFDAVELPHCTSSGISGRFQPLFPGKRQITHVLLTLSPLRSFPKEISSYDLHASSTPSAFNLNQDQILKVKKIFENLISILDYEPI